MIDFRALKAAIKDAWAKNADTALLAFLIAFVVVFCLSVR